VSLSNQLYTALDSMCGIYCASLNKRASLSLSLSLSLCHSALSLRHSSNCPLLK